MNVFLSQPYLPQAAVSLAVGSFAPAGVELIPPPRLSSVSEAVSLHADLGLCALGGGRVVCPPDTFDYYSRRLYPYGFSVIVGGQALTRGYPAEAAYNVVAAGKYAVLNPKTCDRVLLKILENEREIVPVKQGYAKCSVCPVDENSIITADRGIARALEKRGAEVLFISNAGVELPPYENGFFGGAAAMTDKNLLTINGSLGKMESGEKIKKFLERKGINIMEMSSKHPFDTGSLIPLMINANN